MKKFLVAIAVLGFGLSAQADHREIQINGAASGTGGGYAVNNDGNSSTSILSLSGTMYHKMSDNFQVGGNLTVADSNRSDLTFGIGVLGRYNLDTELRDSMFFDIGLLATDVEEIGDTLNLHVGFGKRYALSDTITWTPNISYRMSLESGNDSYVFGVNLLSFSGFM